MNKKINKLFLTFALCLMAVFAFSGIKSEAAKKPSFPKKMTMVYYPRSEMIGKDAPGLSGIGGNDKVELTFKSSNKKVLEVSEGPAKGMMWFTPKKAGTSTVSIQAKVNGKSYDFKCKVTVVKYQNPFKTFKVGDKNYAPKFKKDKEAYVTKKQLKGNLKIALKKNWKLVKLSINNKAIKNNTNIQLKRSTAKNALYYTIKNKKNGVTIMGYLALV